MNNEIQPQIDCEIMEAAGINVEEMLQEIVRINNSGRESSIQSKDKVMNKSELQKHLMQGYAACSFVAVTLSNLKETLGEIEEFEQVFFQVTGIKQSNFFTACRNVNALLTELQHESELLYKAIMEQVDDMSNKKN